MQQPISLNDLEHLRDTLARHEVKYLVIGKGAAILHGYSDTTQDTDLYLEKTKENAEAIVTALRELGFTINDKEALDIERGKDFVQFKDGPFDVDIIFAPDGINNFEDAWRRGVEIEGFPVCSMRDIIASKMATNRTKDREVMRRLQESENYQRASGKHHAKRNGRRSIVEEIPFGDFASPRQADHGECMPCLNRPG